MSETVQKETMGFQAEVKQLLHLMIHSLYSNKEIFLRELISNASDACDKLRFESLSHPEWLGEDSEFKIHIAFDKEAKSLSISDNGIGMSRQEVIDHLGTIAKSGTSQFLSQLSGDQKKDAHLIGQFGVGFYSAFIVAQEVEVITRHACASAAEATRWISKGEGQFTVETIEKAARGTTVILHLKDEETEFAEGYRLRHLVKKYSDHIAVPVCMKKEAVAVDPAKEDQTQDEDKYVNKDTEHSVEEEIINSAQALWVRPKSEIKEEEYQSFYKHIAHDFEDALIWSHNRVEGKLDYTSLLFVPKRAPFDLWDRDAKRGLKLYIQRVFIMDDAEQFLPRYLRFMKGIIDSNDLSLNISRELLQADKNVDAIRSALTKRALDMLVKLQEENQEQYQAFWDAFGQVIKEGPGEDYANKEKIASLMRFATASNRSAVQNVSLKQYVAGMKEGQTKIYYVTAENYTAGAASPHLECFKAKGIEVLILIDRIDEWMISHLREFQGKAFQDLTKGELGDEAFSAEEKAHQEALSKTHTALVERLKQALGDAVKEVRVTARLKESPACLVVGNQDMSAQLRQILKAAGQSVPEAEQILEVNPEHSLLQRMDSEQDEERFGQLSRLVLGQAVLASGGHLENPAEFVKNLNRLLLS